MTDPVTEPAGRVPGAAVLKVVLAVLLTIGAVGVVLVAVFLARMIVNL